jgi:hypothetical protein
VKYAYGYKFRKLNLIEIKYEWQVFQTVNVNSNRKHKQGWKEFSACKEEHDHEVERTMYTNIDENIEE